MHLRQSVAIATSLLLAVSGTAMVGCSSTDEAPSQNNDDPVDAGPSDVDDAGDDADVDPPEPAEVNLLPESITFEGVEIDETEEVTITVQNLGEEPLEVEGVDLSMDEDFDHDLEAADEDEWPEFPATVHGDQAIEFDVAYTPGQAGSTTGQITVESDDADQPEAEIRIQTISAYAELEAPDQVTFGTVEPGESSTIGSPDPDDPEAIDPVEISNRGLQHLNVESIEVDEESEDAEAFEVTNVEGSTELPGSPDTLAQHAFWYLELTFEPETEDQHHAEVVIDSNDPANSEHVIEVTGNLPEACLSSTGNLDFGEMDDGQEMTDTITVLNCSQTRDLELSDIELTDDGGGVFELVDPPEEDPTVLEPVETFDITVRATMTTSQEVVGLLTLSSNAPDAEHVPHQLRARPAE